MRPWTHSTKGMRVHAVEGPERSWKSILDLAPGARILETEGPAHVYYERLRGTLWAEFHPVSFNDIKQLALGPCGRARGRKPSEEDARPQRDPSPPPWKNSSAPAVVLREAAAPAQRTAVAPSEPQRNPAAPPRAPGIPTAVVTLPEPRSVFGPGAGALIGVEVRVLARKCA